jgi:hypothetical protein
MVNLISKDLTKIILIANLMRQKFNPLTITGLIHNQFNFYQYEISNKK